MNHPSLPPRGIFIPTQMIFGSRLPPAILFTWMQLRALAWDGWITPPLSLKEISKMLGKSKRTILNHLSKLTLATGVTWQTTKNGSIIISFPATATGRSQAQCQSFHTFPNEASKPQYPQATPVSYFPAQILGYITYSDDIDRPNMDKSP